MANICCSIETEPRTLNQGQINLAREVAVDIVQKMEPKEASNIFAEGMIPVVSVKEMQQIQIDEKADQFRMPSGCTMEAQLLDKPCQCSCSSIAMESPEQVKPKEPFSAPF